MAEKNNNDGTLTLFILLGVVLTYLVATHGQKTVTGQGNVDVGTGGVRMTDQAHGSERRGSWVDMALNKSRQGATASDTPGGLHK